MENTTEKIKNDKAYFPMDVTFIVKDRETGKKHKNTATWELISQLNALHDINAVHEILDLMLENISSNR